MNIDDLKPGNPLRVRCRTCKADQCAPCVWPAGQQPVRREFHGKRTRDARQDYIANSPPLIVGQRQTQAGRRIRGQREAARAKKDAARRIVTLGELPRVERVLSDVARSAPDINTPAFWNSVWSIPRGTGEG
jgi:hypothetical protein